MARKKIQRSEDVAQLVQSLSKFGISQREIALEVGISERVMVGLYEEEIARGRAAANAQIGKRLFEKAIGGDTACLIFWAKTRMGWREKEARPAEATDQDWKQAFRDALQSVG